MFKPIRVTFLVTSTCTARCAHCSVNSAPDRRDRLDFQRIRRSLDSLAGRGGLRTVIFAGGEPTLLKDHLFESIAYAGSLGLSTRLVTNVAYATSVERARATLLALREAGLDELNISADDYHLPYVPLDNIVNAWRAAKSIGFETVLAACAVGRSSRLTGAGLLEALDDPEARLICAEDELDTVPRQADGTIYVVYETELQRLGRFHRELDPGEVEDIDWRSMEGGCRYAGVSPAVSPKNHLLACCGFEAEHNRILDFGALDAEPALPLLDRAFGDLLVRCIAQKGPQFLASFVEERSRMSPLRGRYGSMCELCEDVTGNPQAVALLREHTDELALRLLGIGCDV